MECVLAGRLTGLKPLRRAAGLACDDPRELLAAAYRRVGDAVLELCEGEFAMALWDRERGCGLLARDRLGSRSLFLATRGGTLFFAEEIRPLLVLLPSRPGPDRVAVAHWLARTGFPGRRTLYDGVDRLPPGYLAHLEAGAWSVRAWWAPTYRPPGIRSRGEAVEALAGAMGSAVDRSLEGTRTPAVMLSGGFDSGSIAALAGTSRPPPAYSAVFPGLPDVDESAAIEAVRDTLRLRGSELRFLGGSALGPAREFLMEHEVPSLSANALVWRPLARMAAANGVDVLVDGEGGDELLGCSPWLIADAVRAGRLRRAVGLARRLPGMETDPPARWVRRGLSHYGVRGALPHGLHMRLVRARGREAPPSWMRPDIAETHRQTHDRWSWKLLDGPAWWSSLVHGAIHLPEAMGAADQQRRESALSRVALRHPYRDHRLLEAVLDIDPELMFDPHLDRPLARAALAPLLPSALRPARKPAFNAVLENALAGPDAALVRAVLEDPKAEIRAFVDIAALREAVHATGVVPRARALDLWRVVTLEHWLQLQSKTVVP